MPDLTQNQLTDLIEFARDLGEFPSFHPTGAPMQELHRLMKLAEDLDSADELLLQEVVSDGKKQGNSSANSKGKSDLHFESRACGTPAPSFHDDHDTTGNGSVVGELAASSLDQTFGTEMLRTLAGHPLSPESRIEALRRLTLAMANPNRQNLESVLMILVTDDPYYDQDRR